MPEPNSQQNLTQFFLYPNSPKEAEKILRGDTYTDCWKKYVNGTYKNIRGACQGWMIRLASAAKRLVSGEV